MDHHTLTRRSLLATGLTASATLVVAGCAPGDTTPSMPTGSPGSGTSAPSPVRPAHIPYDGPKPDLVGDGATGVPNGFLTYPAEPPSTGRVPVNLSAPITFLGLGDPPAVPRDRNQWWQQIESDLGAALNLNIVGSQYVDKFQTSVAGNALGDLTQYTPSAPRLPELLEKMFVDLTPHLAGDAVARYPSLASMPAAAWDMCTINGKIWGVTNPRIPAGIVLMTRGDVLESKGIATMPNLSNGEDFLDMCREVTDRSRNVYAIGQIPQDWTVPVIVEALGGPNTWHVADDGTWTSAYESPEYAQALEIVTTMWSEGLFHPNSFTDLGATLSWFDGGTTVFLAQNFLGWQERLAGAKYQVSFPTGAVVMPNWNGGGAAAKHLGAPGFASPVGLRKTSDEGRIEELLRVMDYIASPFGTVEFLKVNYGVQGRQWTIRDEQVVLGDAGEGEAMMGTGLGYAGSTASVSLYTPGKPDATKQLHAYLTRMVPTGKPNPANGKYSETQLSKGAAATRRLEDVMADIIQGRAALSSWDAAVAAWKSEAGDAIAREYAAG